MSKLNSAVIKSIRDTGDKEEQKRYMQDVLKHGCISGMVAELIYYTDTESFYLEHLVDIMTLLKNTKDNTGLTEAELFGDKWETVEDMAPEFESELDAEDFETEEEYSEACETEWAEFYSELTPFDSKANRNLLAWFAYEETTRAIYEQEYGEEV